MTSRRYVAGSRVSVRVGAFCAVLLLWLSCGVAAALANEPCSPFENRGVDPEILAEMRQAAGAGLLYRIDADASKVGFCVRHFPFREFRGEFTHIVGGLALPPDHADHGHALLLIRTTSLESDSAALVPLVKGRSFIDADRYPEILFVGTRFEWLNAGHAHIFGELTLHGRSRPLIIDVDVEAFGREGADLPERIRVRGKSHVSRFSFDIRSYPLVVSETVQLCLAVELVRWNK